MGIVDVTAALYLMQTRTPTPMGWWYNFITGAIDNGDTLSFDPSTMDPGVVSISVEVSDGVEFAMASVLINVIDTMPSLSSDNATQMSDGIDDLAEGVGDDDKRWNT